MKTPEGLRYVLYAENYLGFLVQRRYRRLPRTLKITRENITVTGDWYEPYLHPFMHPGLLKQTGLGPASLEKWLVEHPGEVFTHPTYASCCLRWGNNPLAYQVQAYPDAKRNRFLTARGPQPLYFIPYTVWASGRTYYRLDATVPATDHWLSTAGMHWHEAEQGEHGSWTGWYALDWEVVQTVVATAPTARYAVLRQPTLPTYRVQLYQAPGLLTEERTLATAEVAWATYAAAPPAPHERTAVGAQVYPRVLLTSMAEDGTIRPYAEKAVLPDVSLAALPLPTPPYLVPRLIWTPHKELLPAPLPLLVREV